MLDEPVLVRDDVDGVVRLTLNRPLAFNSLSRQLLLALCAQIDSLGEVRRILHDDVRHGPAHRR